MNEPRTIAWIFYALELASGKESADFRSISELADGINHAAPTHKEIQSSLSWLSEKGFVVKSERKYLITAIGKSVLSSAHTGATTTSQVLAQLTQTIEVLSEKKL